MNDLAPILLFPALLRGSLRKHQPDAQDSAKPAAGLSSSIEGDGENSFHAVLLPAYGESGSRVPIRAAGGIEPKSPQAGEGRTRGDSPGGVENFPSGTDTQAKNTGKTPAMAAELQRRTASGERGLIPCVTAGETAHLNSGTLAAEHEPSQAENCAEKSYVTSPGEQRAQFANTETKRAVTLPSIDERAESPEGPGRDGNKPLMQNRPADERAASPIGRIDGNTFPKGSTRLWRPSFGPGSVTCLDSGGVDGHADEEYTRGAASCVQIPPTPVETRTSRNRVRSAVSSSTDCRSERQRLASLTHVGPVVRGNSFPSPARLVRGGGQSLIPPGGGARLPRRAPAAFPFDGGTTRCGGLVGAGHHVRVPGNRMKAGTAVKFFGAERFGSGGVRCDVCLEGYPAVLLACPHCGAPKS